METGGQALHVAISNSTGVHANSTGVHGAENLTEAALTNVVDQGILYWGGQGIDPDALATLSTADIRIADLSGPLLGFANEYENTILIDTNAGGYGWALNTFGNTGTDPRVDLLSTVTHEFGHLLGFDHDDHGVMRAVLDVGVGTLPHQLLPGDTNLDGVVDFADFLKLAENFGKHDMDWAGDAGEVLAGTLRDREQRWYNFAERRGYIDMWLSMLSEYFGIQPTALLGFDAAQVQLEGDQGELVRFRVNETRSYVRLAVTTTTKQRPAFQASTTSSESVTDREVDLCESVMEAIYRKWYGEFRERRLVERGELFATMWSWLVWDPEGGEVIDRPVILPNGQVTCQGPLLPLRH